jgi:outer membrane immunogenic protein
MAMRSFLVVAALLFAGASAAVGQEGISGDATATYHWVHTNAGPGQCGCFGLNGGGVSGSWNLAGPWSVVAEVSSEFTANAGPAGHSLTLTSYMAGARYQLPRLPRTWAHGAHRVQPFAQVMVGAAHAGGGIAGIGDASFGFASRVGGGLDVPVSRSFSVRVIQMDYYLTRIANAVNDHQNNFLVGAGIVFRWSLRK